MLDVFVLGTLGWICLDLDLGLDSDLRYEMVYFGVGEAWSGGIGSRVVVVDEGLFP